MTTTIEGSFSLGINGSLRKLAFVFLLLATMPWGVFQASAASSCPNAKWIPDSRTENWAAQHQARQAVMQRQAEIQQQRHAALAQLQDQQASIIDREIDRRMAEMFGGYSDMEIAGYSISQAIFTLLLVMPVSAGLARSIFKSDHPWREALNFQAGMLAWVIILIAVTFVGILAVLNNITSPAVGGIAKTVLVAVVLTACVGPFVVTAVTFNGQFLNTVLFTLANAVLCYVITTSAGAVVYSLKKEGAIQEVPFFMKMGTLHRENRDREEERELLNTDPQRYALNLIHGNRVHEFDFDTIDLAVQWVNEEAARLKAEKETLRGAPAHQVEQFKTEVENFNALTSEIKLRISQLNGIDQSASASASG